MNIRILASAFMIAAPSFADAAELQSVRGNVFVVRDGVNLLAENGMVLLAGNSVSAGVGATAIVAYSGQCQLPLGRDVIISVAGRSPCAIDNQPQSEQVAHPAGEPPADHPAGEQTQQNGALPAEGTPPPPALNMTTILVGSAAIGGIAAVAVSSGGGSSNDKPASP